MPHSRPKAVFQKKFVHKTQQIQIMSATILSSKLNLEVAPQSPIQQKTIKNIEKPNPLHQSNLSLQPLDAFLVSGF